MEIPKKGISREEIMATLESFKKDDIPWRSGKVLAYCYHPGEEVEEVTRDAYMRYLGENLLDPTTFKSGLIMEKDVVRMVANLLRGDDNVVGNFTFGGTESILLAVKTARDKMEAERGITEPEMVLPMTAHAAFHKACAYFKVKPVITGFDPVTFRANVDEMREAITDNTIMLVASSPQYSQGVIDPIEEIGRLAIEKDLLFHVDACVGGIHLSFMRRSGKFDLPPFDFSVPGVTSMSADMHKYGYSPKGASIVLYKNKDIRRYQFFASTKSTVYAFINPAVMSSKTCGPLAGAWAALNYLGEEGYIDIVTQVQAATRKLIEGIEATGELQVLGSPDMSMFSFVSKNINVFQLADEINSRGYYIQPQFSTDNSPYNLHVSVNYATCKVVDEFLEVIKESIEAVKNSKEQINVEAVRAALGPSLTDSSPEAIKQLAETAGIGAGAGSDLPDKMAMMNTMLEIMPAEMKEQILIEFFNELFV
ncbi:MAG TPA: aspartate aminotransferase family protein [bacterium]|nr:aspartate aminotransferase family protein [bacterium]